MRPEDIAFLCAQVAFDKKAEDIIILDLTGITDIAQYFVICTGEVERHRKTIYEEILEKLEEAGVKVIHKDVDLGCQWVVLDFIDVIVHIFSPEARDYYRLDLIWGDARKVEFIPHHEEPSQS